MVHRDRRPERGSASIARATAATRAAHLSSDAPGWTSPVRSRATRIPSRTAPSGERTRRGDLAPLDREDFGDLPGPGNAWPRRHRPAVRQRAVTRSTRTVVEERQGKREAAAPHRAQPARPRGRSASLPGTGDRSSPPAEPPWTKQSDHQRPPLHSLLSVSSSFPRPTYPDLGIGSPHASPDNRAARAP